MDFIYFTDYLFHLRKGILSNQNTSSEQNISYFILW